VLLLMFFFMFVMLAFRCCAFDVVCVALSMSILDEFYIFVLLGTGLAGSSLIRVLCAILDSAASLRLCDPTRVPR
jgi:hypothetical protein